MVALSAITTVPFTAAFYESIIACSTPAVVTHPKPPAYNVIVVPGNPGQPGFYTSFVDELLPMLPRTSTWRVSVIGLRGHVTGATRRKVCNLAQNELLPLSSATMALFLKAAVLKLQFLRLLKAS